MTVVPGHEHRFDRYAGSPCECGTDACEWIAVLERRVTVLCVALMDIEKALKSALEAMPE